MKIICPNCNKIQTAEPQETPQFPTSFVHFCKCGEIIGESDIREVEESYELPNRRIVCRKVKGAYRTFYESKP